MIAKRIPRDKATSSFAKLGRYVIDAKGLADPMTWSRTADYILDTGHGGEKVGAVRVSNCSSDDPAFATAEIIATQALNKRSKGDKSYHLVVSFPAGERPPLEALHQIEDALCASIGFADHQRISAVHTDTDFLHIHVAISKVHPDTLRNVEPYYDKQKLMETCERLEAVYGLQRTNHGIPLDQQPEQQHGKQLDYSNATNHGNDADRRNYLRESYHRALGEEPEAKSLDAVRSLSSSSMVCLESAAFLPLPNTASDDLEQVAAERDIGLRRASDGDGRLGGEAGGGRLNNTKAATAEAHSGLDSLLTWLKRDALPDIAKATDWQTLHKALAASGLEIRKQGAGLIIGTLDGKHQVKASQVDRGLSIAALTKRFGAFTPTPVERQPKQIRSYTATAPAGRIDTSALFTLFQRHRNDAQDARRKAFGAITANTARFGAELATYYKTRRAGVALLPSVNARKAGYSALAKERASDLRKHRMAQAQQRRAVSTMHPLPVWTDWLAQRATQGDVAALAALRSKPSKRAAFLTSWITALDSESAKAVLRSDLQPTVDKRGAVTYQVSDGGRVKDTQNGVRVERVTDAATTLALLLAADKYAGQKLVVEGSEVFKNQVAQAAAARNLQLTFADPILDAIRTSNASVKPAQTAQQKPTSPAAPQIPDALQRFITKRNEQALTTTSIGYHRRWQPADAGTSIYEGRRKLDDGTEAILLKRENVTLVMPVTAAQAAKASTMQLGTKVTTDERGRLIGVDQNRKNDGSKTR